MSRLSTTVSVSARVESHQGDLEDVGGQALDAGVHGLAFTRLADRGSCAS